MDEDFRPPRAGMERIPYRLARGGERGRRAGNVLYWQRRVLHLSGYTNFELGMLSKGFRQSSGFLDEHQGTLY